MRLLSMHVLSEANACSGLWVPYCSRLFFGMSRPRFSSEVVTTATLERARHAAAPRSLNGRRPPSRRQPKRATRAWSTLCLLPDPTALSITRPDTRSDVVSGATTSTWHAPAWPKRTYRACEQPLPLARKFRALHITRYTECQADVSAAASSGRATIFQPLL